MLNPSPKTPRLFLAAFLCAALCPALAGAAIVQVGNVTGVAVTTNATSGIWTASFSVDTGGSVEITPYAPDIVRVDFHWAGPFATEQVMIDKPVEEWPAVTATLTDNGSHYLIQTSELDIEIEKAPYKIHFKDKSGFYLLQDDFTEYDDAYFYSGQSGNTTSKLKCRKVVPTSQAFFGLGEYGGPMNRRGRTLECWNTGTYNWGETTNPTYLNIPFFYGVQPAEGETPAFVYGVFFHNPCRPLFRFGTEASDRYSFQAGDGRMDYFFFGGGSQHTMARVIDRYSELTGRPTMLPKWGLGYHLSRFSYSNQSWVEYVPNQAGLEDIPLDGIYLDIDYMDADGDEDISDSQLRQLTFNFNFPDPAAMIGYCDARGVNVVPLIEPWLEPSDSLHGEANGLLHFIKDNGGSTVTRGIYVGDVSWFDYTSTPMHDWWRGKILNWMSTLDFSGIWNDLTEPEGGDSIPHDALLWLDGQYGDQTDSRRHWSNERNYFGLRCAQQSYNTMQAKDPNLRPFILSRSGNAGLQRYAVSWSGDTAANWWYHEKTLRFGMGAMIAGAAWYGNDVGGFAGSPSGELMVRSTEANFLTPFFRNHGDKAAADREPWRFDSTDAGHQRDLIKLRYRLMPYLYTLAYESTQTGEPMNVPPVFDYYADQNTHSQSDYEYLVGDYVLCAPVYSEGASSRSVYLPYAPGVDWYYWPSGQPSVQPAGEQFGGGQHVTVSAPLGDCPLFVRSGAIIPMGPSMQYANEFQAGWMDINCWPAGDSEFTLHEDDGETWDYLSGEYAKTRFVSSRTAEQWNFTIDARQGTYDPGTRDFYVYCFNPNTGTVQSVTLDGGALDEVADFSSVSQGWKYADGRIGIKLPGNGAAAALVVSWGASEDTLQVAAPTYTVSEADGNARVYVSRTGSATGAVSVTYATADGRAIAGIDYTAAGATLNWPAGDTADRFFDVLISNDTSYQGDRDFSASLSSPNGASLGSPSLTTVTITDDDPLPPDLLITNPPSDIVVGEATTSYDIQGIANPANWTGLIWTNSLTGDSGPSPIGYAWSIAAVPLGVGSNIVTVTATNLQGTGASDSAADPAYGDGWTNGAAGGSGWAGGWAITDSANSGVFIAGPANANNSAGSTAFGMWAHSGDLSDAKRDFAAPMLTGQELSFRFDNNFIENGGGVGFGLQNAAGANLFEFFFVGGRSAYSVNDDAADRDTGIPWSGDGWDILFELTSGTEYALSCGTNLITGTLKADADQEIVRFRAWNSHSGVGGDHDYFFNDLALSGSPSGLGASTSMTVRIVRESGDSQIPQTWRDRYDLSGPDSGDHDDKDGDGRSNLDEFWSDTNPTNSASFFDKLAAHGVTNTGAGSGVIVAIPPPTTNSRVYGLSYASNLVDTSWFSQGPSKPGRPDGGELTFVLTNEVDNHLFYRGRVGTSSAIGQQASLVTRAHGVSGTATILNGNDIVLSEFNYDGTGIDVYAIISPNSGFSPYTVISGDLLNPAGYSNETLYLTLPPDVNLDDVSYFSIWCIPAITSFGDGAFE